MISSGPLWLLVSVAVFGILITSIQAEKKRGRRFLLPGVRNVLDEHIAAVGLKIVKTWDHFTKYVVQLGWYYGMHSFLRAILATLVTFYERVENAFEHNRRRTKRLRAEKNKVTSDESNHLTVMAQHKADTALTPAQQRKLKATQLKGD